MDIRIRWADLGPLTHAALGIDPDRWVLVVNTRELDCGPEMTLALRQAVDVCVGSPVGLALLADTEATVTLFARLDGRLSIPQARVPSQVARA